MNGLKIGFDADDPKWLKVFWWPWPWPWLAPKGEDDDDDENGLCGLFVVVVVQPLDEDGDVPTVWEIKNTFKNLFLYKKNRLCG